MQVRASPLSSCAERVLLAYSLFLHCLAASAFVDHIGVSSHRIHFPISCDSGLVCENSADRAHQGVWHPEHRFRGDTERISSRSEAAEKQRPATARLLHGRRSAAPEPSP